MRCYDSTGSLGAYEVVKALHHAGMLDCDTCQQIIGSDQSERFSMLTS